MCKIMEVSDFSFEYYKRLVEYYLEKDCREINFQNRIVLPMLEKIFYNDDEISIVDVSTQYKNRESSRHTRKPYANKFTPDLLIVKNWKYENKDIPENNYLAVVEIKSPILDSISEEKIHTIEEVQDYINNGSKVILTDCFKWVFYGFEGNPKTFILYNKEDGWEKSRIESTVWEELLSYIRKIS